jgi:hypothetical protein
MDTESISRRFNLMKPYLNERQRRLWTAAEAEVIGYSGISIVSRSTGMSRQAIAQGQKELKTFPPCDEAQSDRIRKKGGGRKLAVEKDSTLLVDLEDLVEPVTRGDPESPLRWTCKSLRNLAHELKSKGHAVSHDLVGRLLEQLGYSLQANSKTSEGASHPDRNAQFEHIYQTVKSFQRDSQPVISVDTKKKELVGDFKNAGREYRPKGEPEKVRVHDFIIPEMGRATPFGVYDVTSNTGWVNVGIDHDTSAFAVESIRRWWYSMGKPLYAQANRLLITSDCGGSNGYRLRLWKIELQKLANETGLAISVCHFPPGTSKWNYIEHRMFSFITQNWRGKPLISHEVIVNLIAATKNRKGLRIESCLDTNTYPDKIKVSDKEMKSINLLQDDFHGEWNYTIKSNTS